MAYGQHGAAWAACRPAAVLFSSTAVLTILITTAYLRAPASIDRLNSPPSATASGFSPVDDEDRGSSYHPPPHFCAQLPEPPIVCAHGGDTSGGAPTGTLAAFQAAADAGLPCIEVDVADTAGGELVVMHVRQLRALLPGQPTAQVWEMPLAGVQGLRWPGGEGVPLVQHVLESLAPRFQHITLDVKVREQDGRPVDVLQTAHRVAALLQDTQCAHCLVWSKADSLVAAMAEQRPSSPLGYVVINETASHRAAGMHRILRLPQAQVVGMHHEMASQSAIAAAHAGGKTVHAWTCNTPSMMHAALDARVDAIVTDAPHLLLQVIKAREQQCQMSRDEL